MKINIFIFHFDFLYNQYLLDIDYYYLRIKLGYKFLKRIGSYFMK